MLFIVILRLYIHNKFFASFVYLCNSLSIYLFILTEASKDEKRWNKRKFINLLTYSW